VYKGFCTSHRGQFVTSFRQLASIFGTTTNTVRVFLAALEDTGMIKRESTKLITIITIIDYDRYQSNSVENEDISTHKLTHKRTRKLTHIKEKNNIEEVNKSSFSSAQEQKFFDELKADTIFFENAAASLNTKIPVLISFAEKFQNEMLARKKYHSGSQDYREHFFNWVRLAISKDSSAPQNLNEHEKSSQPNQNRYSARRGTEVGAKDVDEYNGTF
jgi:DNA-binding transcriptional regulator YhcF (GntR family)